MNFEAGRISADALSQGGMRARASISPRSFRVRMIMLMIALDIVCIVGSFLIGDVIYHMTVDQRSSISLIAAAGLMVPVYLTLAANNRAFSARISTSPAA